MRQHRGGVVCRRRPIGLLRREHGASGGCDHRPGARKARAGDREGRGCYPGQGRLGGTPYGRGALYRMGGAHSRWQEMPEILKIRRQARGGIPLHGGEGTEGQGVLQCPWALEKGLASPKPQRSSIKVLLKKTTAESLGCCF